MKRHFITAFLTGMALLIMPVLYSTDFTAHAGNIIPASPGASQPNAEGIQQQISALNEQIKEVQQQLEQAKKERQRLQQDMQALNKARPVLPPGSSTTNNPQYNKDLNDWQAKMDALKDKITLKDREIEALEAKLKKLELQQQALQKTLPPSRKRPGA